MYFSFIKERKVRTVREILIFSFIFIFLFNLVSASSPSLQNNPNSQSSTTSLPSLVDRNRYSCLICNGSSGNSSGGFTTDQNNELNKSGNPTFNTGNFSNGFLTGYDDYGDAYIKAKANGSFSFLNTAGVGEYLDGISVMYYLLKKSFISPEYIDTKEIEIGKKIARRGAKFVKARSRIVASNVRAEYGSKPLRLRVITPRDIGF